MSDTADNRSFLDRQRDAALEIVTEQQKAFREVAELVIPSDRRRSTNHRVTDVIKLGDDHLVEVTNRNTVTDKDEILWTFVVGGERSNEYHHRQEDAILHLIASRYDDNPNSSINAAFYAGRVLGVPEEKR